MDVIRGTRELPLADEFDSYACVNKRRTAVSVSLEIPILCPLILVLSSHSATRYDVLDSH